MNPHPLVLKILLVGSANGSAWHSCFELLGWQSTACSWSAGLDQGMPEGPWDAVVVDMTVDKNPEAWLELHHLVSRSPAPVVAVCDGPVPFSFHYPRGGGLRIGLLQPGASPDVVRSTINLVRQIYQLVRPEHGPALASPLDDERNAVLLETVRRLGQDLRTVQALLDPAERTQMRVQPLRGREQEVYGLLMRGLSLQAMADKLAIAESTVKKHVHAIYQKRGVSSRAELMASG